MNLTTNETVSVETARLPKHRSVPRRCRRLAFLATACLGLAAFGMAQEPGAPVLKTRLEPSQALEAGDGLKAAPAATLPAQCPIHVITAGVPDNFAPGNPEVASPSPSLQHVLTGVTFATFDSTVPNQGFATTLQLPRCGCIVGAKLEFRAKALNDNPTNDVLTLGFSGLTNFPRWNSSFTALAGHPWTSGTAPTTFTLDLAALPTVSGSTISLLSALQTNRYLDVYVEDDTSIDYIKLTYTMCNCSPCK
jgi:hypothetical protein